MAPQTLESRKRIPPPDEARTPVNKQPGERTDSDSDGGAAAPPKKPKFVAPLKQPGSTPSASKAKAKAKGKGNGSSSNKLFGNDDEITLLKRLAEFWAKGKNNKWAEFHHFVKDDLRNQFTRTQVSEKIRTFKKRFDANWERSRANGGRIDMSDPHESAVFELSKALWGDEKAEKAESGEEEAIEISTEKEQVVEKLEASKEQVVIEQVVEKLEASKEQVVVEQGEGSNKKKKKKKRKQVSENAEEENEKSKKKKRKQVSENAEEENEKSKKPEHGVEELVEEGDDKIDDAANMIVRIRKVIDENCEESKKAKKKKKKKSKVVDKLELDEKKVLVKEDIQVQVNDDGNKISSKETQVDDGGSKRNKKKTKSVDECGAKEEDKSIGGDEDAEKSPKEVDHHGEEKQGTAIGLDEFQSAYPLLYASLNCPEHPKNKYVGIEKDDAEELEGKWRDIYAEMDRLELKKLDLMSHQKKLMRL